MKNTKEQLKAKEKRYYELQDRWNKDNSDTEAWNEMWLLMNDAVLFNLKKMLKGIKRNDLQELALDATCNIMARYKKPNGYKTDTMVTCAYLAAKFILRNEKQQLIDKEYSYENIFSENR